MVAPCNSALKAMHNREWHHHQLYLWDKKRHEWSWDIVSGHILTKIWQVSCSVDTSCVCIDMFLSLDSWLSSPTWLPRGHVRLPPSRRSPWGIDLVPGSHVIMSCHVMSCHVMSCHVISWSKYPSPKSWETWKKPVGFKSSCLTPSERTIKTILDNVRWPLQRWRLVLLAKLLLPVVSLRPYLQRKLW